MLLPLLLALAQQPGHGAPLPTLPQDPALPRGESHTTPPSRDTTGYWQQRASYVVTATLDEPRQRLVARGTMTYVNRSPDVLRELWLHQYLNAFRPGSRWSRDDAREGRVRFQELPEPAFGYERFTARPEIDGVPVTPSYPVAPDSTVVRLMLPRPLRPGDSVVVRMEWEARPSTTPRRQGRRGRQWDFAHWYPKPAVYDRGGWQPQPLVPAGEFYSEFGDYDVTLVVRDDQVLGATGVPVSGDPGWQGALKAGSVTTRAGAYDASSTTDIRVDSGYKAVRWIAKDVHTFAFSASPDYRYEGGAWVPPRREGFTRWPSQDTVAIHVLYRPGDEATWGGGQAVRRTAIAMAWLDSIYGPYPYPQVTNLHRLDGGGTEFPMMMMNGSPSQGLILHEGGHIYTYGILANNEWRSGWMDEGLTSYQTSWAQRLTRHERAGVMPAPTPERGYGARAVRPRGVDAGPMSLWHQVVTGRAEPIGTRSDLFREFASYNTTIYSRAEMMFGQLRDAMGDAAFRDFLRGYYARWGLKHVDEAAMRAEASRAAGRDMGWFFDQWVHRTGLTDYALGGWRTTREGNEWVTRASVRRVGAYRHPMPVGARTSSGWTIARADAARDRDGVVIRTSERPVAVMLDPLRTTEDWYAPNDGDVDRVRNVVDWPFLNQRSAEQVVAAWSPLAWYGEPGRLALGARRRANYQGIANRWDVGLAVYSHMPDGDGGCAGVFLIDCDRRTTDDALARLQAYATVESPYRGGRPGYGTRLGVWALDGVGMAEWRRTRDASRYTVARSAEVSRSTFVRATLPFADTFAPLAFATTDTWVADAGYLTSWTAPAPVGGAAGWRTRLAFEGTLGTHGARGAAGISVLERTFATLQLDGSVVRRARDDRHVTALRGFVGFQSDRTPLERALYLGSRNPTETFGNHLVRPRNGLLSHPDVPYLVPGAAGMRGYAALQPVGRVASLNAEQAVRLARLGGPRRPVLFATAFADGALPLEGSALTSRPLGDAGVGLAVRGPLFDREVRLRVDLPLWVSEPALAIGRQARERAVGLRVGVATSDLW